MRKCFFWNLWLCEHCLWQCCCIQSTESKVYCCFRNSYLGCISKKLFYYGRRTAKSKGRGAESRHSHNSLSCKYTDCHSTKAVTCIQEQSTNLSQWIVTVRGLTWGKLKATFVLLKDSFRHVGGEASSLQFNKLVHFN